EDDDDEEENIATVMRDFSDVRAQLAALGASLPDPTAPSDPPPAPGRAPDEPDYEPPRAGPMIVASPPLRARAPTALGGLGVPRPAAGAPAVPPPARGSGPGLARPPLAPPRNGAAASAPVAIDDDESEEEVATVLMDTEASDLAAAIERALADKQSAE